MKNYLHFSLLFLTLVSIVFSSCKTKDTQRISPPQDVTLRASNDTVSIKSTKVEYEIIIIEPGFNAWLIGNARPKGYHGQTFLENRNRRFVIEWNNRVSQPMTFNPQLYELRIDYNPNIDYGYDLNYQIYNYFIYFQLKYNQQLTEYIPRI